MSDRVRSWLTGTPLLAFGIGVLLFSLYATRVESAGVSFASEPVVQEDSSWQEQTGRMLDPQMPGSPLYAVDRVGDRVEMWWVEDSDLIGKKLELVRERTDAALYALEKGETEQSLLTYTKAFIYLHEATHECHELAQTGGEDSQLCSIWRSDVVGAAQYLEDGLLVAHQGQVSDSQRANLDRILAQIGSLRLQFGF